MARPPKKSDEQRSCVVSFRVTAAEHAALTGKAVAAGMTQPADFARRAALRGRVAVQQTAKADPEVIRQLVRIGVNLNQLTRTANGVGSIPPDLDRLCRKIEAIVDKAIGPELA